MYIPFRKGKFCIIWRNRYPLPQVRIENPGPDAVTGLYAGFDFAQGESDDLQTQLHQQSIVVRYLCILPNCQPTRQPLASSISGSCARLSYICVFPTPQGLMRLELQMSKVTDRTCPNMRQTGKTLQTRLIQQFYRICPCQTCWKRYVSKDVKW